MNFLPYPVFLGTKYHPTRVESIRKVTHDTKLYTLRLPTGSYMNVPTGHHLAIKANIEGTLNQNYQGSTNNSSVFLCVAQLSFDSIFQIFLCFVQAKL